MYQLLQIEKPINSNQEIYDFFCNASSAYQIYRYQLPIYKHHRYKLTKIEKLNIFKYNGFLGFI